MMGGRINVFSKYGEGSTFRVYLEQEIVSMEIPEGNQEEIEIDYEAHKGKRILVVDDSKINIKVDIMMPKMNGIEALRRLKEINGFNVPVIALTADAIEGQDEKYISAGFNDYLSKPIDKYELNRVLNKFLGGKDEK